MIVLDKRKKCTIPVQDVSDGMFFEDMSGNLFMKIYLDSLCYPPNLDYDKTDVAVDLEEFGVCFFHHDTEVCLVHTAELILS